MPTDRKNAPPEKSGNSGLRTAGVLRKGVFFICGVGALGGLLFGFDTAVIAGATRSLTLTFHLSPGALGLTVSSALWGTVLGSLVAGGAADRFGRKSCLMTLGLLYLVTALGCALAWNWCALLVFRTMGGLAIGASSVICPTYIAEVAPAQYRGRLVALFQTNVVIGILVAYVSNYLVGFISTDATDWRWKFAASALPALLFYGALFGIPESPRWLAGQGRREEALRVLARTGEADPEGEVKRILASLKEDGHSAERLFQRRYRLPVLLAIAVAAFNQLSGVNAVLYYLNSIFESAGFNRISSDQQSVLIGLANLAAVLIAMLIIDRVGRRALLLIGSVGTTVCLLGVALIYRFHSHQAALLWCLVGFIGFFSFSQGAVIWVYISEIFPNHVRAKGQSLGSFTHWIMNAVIATVFPVVAARWISAPFFFFSAMMGLQFFVVLLFFPETRGVALEAMEERLRAKAIRG